MQARHPNAREARLDLADRYEDLVRAKAEHERELGLNSIPNSALSEQFV